MTLYGYRIVWGGGLSSVSVSGCTSGQQAYEKCVELALSCGWEAPGWWQGCHNKMASPHPAPVGQTHCG